MSALPELRELIARWHDRPRPIEGLELAATPDTTRPTGNVTRPMVAIVAQGAKRTVLGDRIFDYAAGQYLVATVDLPVTGHITRASRTEPFLALGLPLREELVAQLLLETGTPRSGVDTGMVTADADEALLDAVVRLLRLFDRPDDFAVLVKGVEREIHWRLMTGPHAATVRRIGMPDSRVALVGHAVRWLVRRFDQPIRIDDLASHVGVSVATLNRHFRAVTAMSPLQYQKQLRLQEARVRLMAASDDVAGVGYAVGYDSPSQFSREYRRTFGVPPSRDVQSLS